MNNVCPRQNTICAVVITYHPGDNVSCQIEALIDQVDRILIVDNGSSPSAVAMLSLLETKYRTQVTLILNEKNVGVAMALNQGMRWAQEHGYDWAITFDQDSCPQNTLINVLCGVYRDIPDNNKIAVLGPNYIDPHVGTVLRVPSTTRWIEKKTLITSGSLLSLSVYDAIGPFRDDFFIDEVDHEYCLRAYHHGYKIILATEVLMTHAIGAKTHQATMHIPGIRTIRTSNHAPFRRYYMTRNRLIVIRTYFLRDPIWALVEFLRLWASIIVVYLFEEQRWSKTKYIFLGLWDGIINNTRREVMSYK